MSYDPEDTLECPGLCQCGSPTMWAPGAFLCVTSAKRPMACLAREPELHRIGSRARGGYNAAVVRLVADARRIHREDQEATHGL